VIATVVAAGCVPSSAPPARDGKDLLVLELGGSAPSLRESLARTIELRRRALHRERAGPAALPTDASGGPTGERARGPSLDAPRKEPPPAPADVVEPIPSEPKPKKDPPPGRERDADREPGRADRGASSEPPVRRVRLRPGQTLYRLAAEHLGDGKRWREIATLNGFGEADITNLPRDLEILVPAR